MYVCVLAAAAMALCFGGGMPPTALKILGEARHAGE
jgi:hypothetical protein